MDATACRASLRDAEPKREAVMMSRRKGQEIRLLTISLATIPLVCCVLKV